MAPSCSLRVALLGGLAALTLPGAALAALVGKGRQGGGVEGGEMKTLLDSSSDPRDPHDEDFEPRLGVDEGGDLWAFGKTHAALHHVIGNVPSGNATAAADLLDAFSAMYSLSFGLTDPSAQLLDSVVRQALDAEAQEAQRLAAATPDVHVYRGLRVLVLGAGLGGRTLRCLPPLLEMAAQTEDMAHDVVSVEYDSDLSFSNLQLVSHALGEENEGSVVRHLPMMPGDDTTLDESLESLRDNYDLPTFHMVLLDENDLGRVGQQQQLMSLLRSGALRDGTIIHAEGSMAGNPETDRYLDTLGKGGGDRSGKHKFESHVTDLGGGRAAVVSKVRRRGDEL
mmetsp:Transcript_12907/g.35033  ORF Transcript_12907/g.35033 Transcript_12907/m.35033 type:complete len:339 (-) Transcript_12907:35-1051(-)